MPHRYHRASPLATVTWHDVTDLEAQLAFRMIHGQLLLSKHHAAAEACVTTLRRAADDFVASTQHPKAWL
jgi:hypothetical protein